MGSWTKTFLKLARQFEKKYEPSTGDPNLWMKPADGALCKICDRKADLVVTNYGQKECYCVRCADMKVEINCKGCGVPIPATSNIDSYSYCALCGQKERTKPSIKWPDIKPIPADPNALPKLSTVRERMKYLVKKARNREKTAILEEK